MNTAMTEAAPRHSLVAKVADRYGVDGDKLLSTLKQTAFRQKAGTEITNAQMMALLVVADQYRLNPFTKEIYAFEDKGAIVPIVSVDGWSRIINEHPELDGIEFNYSDEIVTPEGGKPCPEWCEVVIHRKDRARPTVVREYLDEVYRPPSRRRDGSTYASPWQTHTKRFLRHKTLIQGSRVAFGFAGIFDQDEGERIIEGQAQRVEPRADIADLQKRLEQRAETVALDADFDVVDEPAPQVDPETGEVLPPELQS